MLIGYAFRKKKPQKTMILKSILLDRTEGRDQTNFSFCLHAIVLYTKLFSHGLIDIYRDLTLDNQYLTLDNQSCEVILERTFLQSHWDQCVCLSLNVNKGCQ